MIAPDALWRELARAAARRRQSHLEWLLRQGVPAEAVLAIGGLIGVGRILRDAGGYQPDDQAGEPALILPVYERCGGLGSLEARVAAAVSGDWLDDDPGELVDLVALPIAEPTVTLRRRKAAAWWNAYAVRSGGGEEVTVHRTVWSWLLAGGRAAAAVPLSSRRAIPDLLRVGAVHAEDEEHAQDLAEEIRRAALRGVPLIRYPTAEHRHAA